MDNTGLKKRLRYYVAKTSSYTEILISVLLLVGICVAVINLAIELGMMSKEALMVTDVTLPIEDYLATGLQLIIGVEFVKMISKHTVSSTIDVLLFAIARKLVVSHGTTFDLLGGIIGIAILFMIKRYFGNKCEYCPIDRKSMKQNNNHS